MWTMLSYLVLFGGVGLTSAFPEAPNVTEALHQGTAFSDQRQLAAAFPVSQLSRRNSELQLVHSCDLKYAEDVDSDGHTDYVATIHVESLKPILLLEENDHHFSAISCTNDSIRLSMSPDLDVQSTRNILATLLEGYAITSHSTCNKAGERQTYKVKRIDHLETDSPVLFVEVAPWVTSFDKFSVSMEHSANDYILRSDKLFSKRQEATTASVDGGPTTGTLNVPEPTATSTDSDSSFDLSHSIIDETLLSIGAGGERLGLEFGCKNCTTHGTLNVTWMNFEFNCTDFNLLDGFSLNDLCLQGGRVTVDANDVGAHMEFTTNVTVAQPFGVNLFTIPALFGFKIFGIGTVGLIYAPAVSGELALNGSAGFVYGFDTQLTDSSTLVIDIPNPSGSSFTGFQNPSFDFIPVQTSTRLQSLTASIALRNQLLFGITWDIAILPDLTAGIYIDLPKFEAKFEPKTDVDINCAPLSNSTTVQSQADRDLMATLLTNALDIQPSVGWDIGFEITAGIINLPFSLANGTFAEFGETCVNWNNETGVYESAQQVFNNAKDRQNGGDGEGAAPLLMKGNLGMSLGVQSTAVALIITTLVVFC